MKVLILFPLLAIEELKEVSAAPRSLPASLKFEHKPLGMNGKKEKGLSLVSGKTPGCVRCSAALAYRLNFTMVLTELPYPVSPRYQFILASIQSAKPIR